MSGAYANPLSQPSLQHLLTQNTHTLAGAPTYLSPNQLTLLQRFYAARAYQLAWTNTDNQAWSNPFLTSTMFELATQHGLNPKNPAYHQARLLTLTNELSNASTLTEEKRLLLELWLSSAFMTLSEHLVHGVAPKLGANTLYSTVIPHEFNAAKFLEQALQHPNPAHKLDSLAPNHPAYRQLQKALSFYQTLAQNGDWLTDPEAYLNPENVRHRLMRTGDYAQPNRSNTPSILDTLTRPGQSVPYTTHLSWQWADTAQENTDTSAQITEHIAEHITELKETPKGVTATLHQATLEDAFEQGIRAFQHRHNLTVDGVVGLKTRLQMADSVGEVIARIRANLERWRWFQHNPNQHYIDVNIADFSLRYVNHAHNLTMKAVVGTQLRKTPMMEASLNHLVFNPYWRIPKTILINDVLPKLKKDIGYLNAHNIKIFSLSDQQERYPLNPYAIDWQNMPSHGILNYRFRQDAGPKNALGSVKFMFPNGQDIYIHDTPARNGFSQATRLASSGCIRAEKPQEWAFEILKRDRADITYQTVNQLMQPGPQQTLWLKEPIPVYLTYQTVWADDSGRLFSRPDVYNYDSKLLDLFRIKP
jgi:murein L,D-transpeptidase YcbB/YkuD